jgi:hypothetical protein
LVSTVSPFSLHLHIDDGFAMQMGYRMANGGVFGREIWDFRGPLFFVPYWVVGMIRPFSRILFFLLVVAIYTLIGIAAYKISRKYLSKSNSILASSLFVVISAVYDKDQLSPDTLIVFFILVSGYTVVKIDATRLNWVVSGICITAIFLIKPNAILGFCIGILIFLFYSILKKKITVKKLLFNICFLSLGCVVSFSLVLVIFNFYGAVDGFIYHYILENLAKHSGLDINYLVNLIRAFCEYVQSIFRSSPIIFISYLTFGIALVNKKLFPAELKIFLITIFFVNGIGEYFTGQSFLRYSISSSIVILFGIINIIFKIKIDKLFSCVISSVLVSLLILAPSTFFVTPYNNHGGVVPAVESKLFGLKKHKVGSLKGIPIYQGGKSFERSSSCNRLPKNEVSYKGMYGRVEGILAECKIPNPIFSDMAQMKAIKKLHYKFIIAQTWGIAKETDVKLKKLYKEGYNAIVAKYENGSTYILLKDNSKI